MEQGWRNNGGAERNQSPSGQQLEIKGSIVEVGGSENCPDPTCFGEGARIVSFKCQFPLGKAESGSRRLLES